MARTDLSAETKSRASARMAGLASTATVRNSIVFLVSGEPGLFTRPTTPMSDTYSFWRLLVLCLTLVFSSFSLGVIWYTVCASDHVCDSLVPTGKNGTCYQGGLTVYENFQQCDVTSKFSLQRKKNSLVRLLRWKVQSCRH